ncbi:MAG: AMP-binding protein [Alcaligenaceae bacterium]|nr:AMP-binding protein [Alcaligenaceae bacterium]
MPHQYKELYKNYEWVVPHEFNLADMCCHRWTKSPHQARQIAVYFEDQVSQQTRYSYQDLSSLVNKLANAYLKIGISSGDRILIALEHSPESLIALLACATIGAIAVILPPDLDQDQYTHYIEQTKPKLGLTDEISTETLLSAMQTEHSILQLIATRTDNERIIEWHSLLARQSDECELNPALPDTPLMLMYEDPRSCPKTARVFTHGCLLGYLPGFVCMTNWFHKPRDNVFTFFGWNTYEGLLHAVLPCLYFGRSVIGCPPGRTVPRLFSLLEFYCITHVHATAEDLNKLKNYHDGLYEFALSLRCIYMPYDEVTHSLAQWIEHRFNLIVNRYLSSMTFPPVIVSSTDHWTTSDGYIGRVTPGFEIALMNNQQQAIQAPHQSGKLHVKQLTPCGQHAPGVMRYIFENERFSTFITQHNLVPSQMSLSCDDNGCFTSV